MLTFILLSLTCAAAAVAVGLSCNGCGCSCGECCFCKRTFAEADTSTIPNGGDAQKCWLTERLGDWRIVSGKLEVVTPTTEAIISTPYSSTPIEVDITFTAAGQQPGILLVYGDNSNYTALYFTEGTANVTYRRVVAGTPTEVTIPVSTTFTNGSTYTFLYTSEMIGNCAGDDPPPDSQPSYCASFLFASQLAGALWIDGAYACAVARSGDSALVGLYLKSVTTPSPQWDEFVLHDGDGTDCDYLGECYGCCECGDAADYMTLDMTALTIGGHGCDLACAAEVLPAVAQNFCLIDLPDSHQQDSSFPGRTPPHCTWGAWCDSSADIHYYGNGCEGYYTGTAPYGYNWCYHVSISIIVNRRWDHDAQRCRYIACFNVTVYYYCCDPATHDPMESFCNYSMGGHVAVYEDLTGDTGAECGARDPVVLTLISMSGTGNFDKDDPGLVCVGAADDALFTFPETITITPTDTPCDLPCDPLPTTTTTLPPTTTTTTTPIACVDYPCDIICNDPMGNGTGTWAQSGDENCGSQGGDCGCGATGPSGDFLEGDNCGAGCASSCIMYITSRTVLGVEGFYWTDSGDCTNGTVSCNCHYLRTAVGRGYAIHNTPADGTDITAYYGYDLPGSCYVNSGEIISGACRI